ncbi:MAG: flagellar hook-length control protein FliK, partial [Parvibaculum sp.]|uniref:flagellar hook-length control protein FliK n=1 Tax=Parvibaculum sp. TaxID=2024848 RepID=UPI0028515D82
APLAATGASGTAGTDTAQTDNAAANPDGDLAIKATKDGLGHQAAANLAEKSAANATNAAQTVNAAAAATAQAAATPASAATFASKIAQASGEGVVTGVSASGTGTAGSSLTAQLSDLQNAGTGQAQSTNTATATVRIGTLPGQTQPTQVPAMAIALQIAKNLQNGVNSFDIRLDPAEMGRIDIRMAVQRDGTVAAHVTADQKTTLDLLQRDSQSLQQALTDAGLQANSDSLSFSLRDQNSGGNAQNLASGNSDAAPVAAQTVADTAAASPIYNVNLSATGGVDIRV